MIEAAEPLSNGVQVGLRIPVILIGLAGVVLMLIFMKRLGVVAALLGALGSFLIAVDQVINIVWVVHTSSLATSEDFDAEHFNSVTNIYTFTDVALITIGTALVVLAIVVRRPASSVPAQAGYPGQPGFPGQPAGQIQPGQFLQPGQFGQQPYQEQPGQFGQQPYQEQPQSAPPANYPQPPANYPQPPANYPQQQQPYQAPPQPPSQPAYPPEEQPDSAPPTQPFYQQQPYQGQPQSAPPPNYQQPPYPGQQ